MNKEIKDRWTADLRSGQYRQGHERLRPGESRFCCLGVLCEQAVAAGITEWDGKAYGGYSEYLSPAVREWAGLESNPAVTCLDRSGAAVGGGGDGKYLALATLNDAGVPFTRIADLIEEQL